MSSHVPLRNMHDILWCLPDLLAFVSDLDREARDEDDAVEGDATGFRAIAIQAGLITDSKRIVGAANLVQARMIGAKGELFTLSVVAYALPLVSMSE